MKKTEEQDMGENEPVSYSIFENSVEWEATEETSTTIEDIGNPSVGQSSGMNSGSVYTSAELPTVDFERCTEFFHAADWGYSNRDKEEFKTKEICNQIYYQVKNFKM